MKTLALLFALLFAGAAHGTASPGNCTFTIKGTFDGVVVDVKITVSDVNAVECLLLKTGVKKAIK